MKPFFPTYLIKQKAKMSMRGKFRKCFAITLVETGVVLLIALALFALMPGVKAGFDLILSGSFGSLDERTAYMQIVFQNYSTAILVLNALFSFVSVGAAKQLLNILRGKEARIKGVFTYYNKWYVALIFPFITVAASIVPGYVFALLKNIGVSSAVVGILSFAFEIFWIVIAYKLMFINYTLADNECTSFIDAAKKSWNMVGMATALNNIVLMLSFLGWLFVAGLTGGILFIYVMPYMSLAIAALYELNMEM